MIDGRGCIVKRRAEVGNTPVVGSVVPKAKIEIAGNNIARVSIVEEEKEKVEKIVLGTEAEATGKTLAMESESLSAIEDSDDDMLFDVARSEDGRSVESHADGKDEIRIRVEDIVRGNLRTKVDSLKPLDDEK